MDINTLYKLANGGALVLGFAVFVWMVGHYTVKLSPQLDALKKSVDSSKNTINSNQMVMEKLLEGNASAFRELSSSNHNVATALGLLTRTMEQSEGSLQRHEELSQKNFDHAFSGIREVQRTQSVMQMELTNHVTKCDTRYGRGIHPCD